MTGQIFRRGTWINEPAQWRIDDGTLVVTSPDGGPTVVRAEIPCAS